MEGEVQKHVVASRESNNKVTRVAADMERIGCGVEGMGKRVRRVVDVCRCLQETLSPGAAKADS